MATRRDDRAARIAANFTSDPFFDENAAPRPARAPTMGFAPQQRAPRNELVDEGDLLEEADEYGEESTRLHASALEEGVLDEDDMGAGFGDEERTMIWQGHDEAPAEQWPTPSPAPIVYAARPARATGAVPPAAAPRPARRTEPEGRALHYGSPGVAEVAPRRTLTHQPAAGVIVAEPYAPPPSQPVQRQAIAPRPAPNSAAPAPQPEQRGMPPLQVALIVLLAVLATVVVALAVRLGRPPATPTPAATPSTVMALFTEPAGATVKVDGVAHGSLTPTVLTALELGRTYNVSLELPGHETITTTIVPDSTAPLERQFTLVPVTGTLVVTSNPAGASITFDGAVRGPAPQTVTGLDLSRTYTVSATLDGHTPATQAIRWTQGGPTQQTVELGLAPLPPAPELAAPVAAAPPQPPAAPAVAPATTATPRTERSAERTATTSTRTETAPTTTRTERPSSTQTATQTSAARPSERPSQRPSASQGTTSSTSTSAAPASGGGTISVQAVPYGQVWINNRVVANETPLLNHELPVGVHQVKVYFSSLRTFSDERSIRIEPGSSRTLTFRAPPQP